MEKYKVLFNSNTIGTLIVREDETYKFVPEENVPEGTLEFFSELKKETEFGEKIPIIENRLKEAKRMGEKNNIYSHTDTVVLKKI